MRSANTYHKGKYNYIIRAAKIRTKLSNLASDLVSVQPLAAPSGLIFYVDYKYGSGSLDTKIKTYPPTTENIVSQASLENNWPYYGHNPCKEIFLLVKEGPLDLEWLTQKLTTR